MPEADRRERGMVSMSYVVAASLAMIFFAALANLIVMQYAAGAVRAALDEGVRNGASAGADAAWCQQTIDDFLGAVLGGPYGSEISTSCVDEGDLMTAQATATFRAFVPIVPDLTFEFDAVAARERLVEPALP